jgi:hypothetical protein
MEECDSTTLPMFFLERIIYKYRTGHTIKEEKVQNGTIVEI